MLRNFFWALSASWLVAGECWGGLVLTGTSHFENFNSPALPENWTVRTGATDSELGVAVALGAGSWASTTGQFFSSASVSGLPASTSSANQLSAADRALSVRQTGAFGDPGAAFVLEIANTSGFEKFHVALNAERQSLQGRETTWQVDYGFGSNPTAFTSIGNVDLGTTFGETANRLAFGAALDDRSGPVWIRIAATVPSIGAGSRDTFGIDDFQLTYSVTAVPEPSSMALLGFAGCAGLVSAQRRRARSVRLGRR